MATKGHTIINNITGEKFTWQQTAADTNGAYLKVSCEIAPAAKVAVRHVHPTQDETFEIKEGVLRLEINGVTKNYGAGERVMVPRGAPHFWRNLSETKTLYMDVTFTPAKKTEIFFEQFFGLGNDCKTDKTGTPTFLQIMAMANEYEIYLAAIPLQVQKIMSAVIGSIAQALGYRKFYPAYSI